MRDRVNGDSTSGLPPDVHATVVTVGTFDGVHRGHRDVLDRLVARGKSLGLRTVLVTFEPHPLEIVNPAAAPLMLTVGEEKREVLAESGIDYLAVVPFTPALARYAAQDFVMRVLRDRFGMEYLLMGYDHGFGRNREGDVEVLQALGAREGFRVEVVPPVSVGDGRPISSTWIRTHSVVEWCRVPREDVGWGSRRSTWLRPVRESSCLRTVYMRFASRHRGERMAACSTWARGRRSATRR
jgi:FAD synthase